MDRRVTNLVGITLLASLVLIAGCSLRGSGAAPIPNQQAEQANSWLDSGMGSNEVANPSAFGTWVYTCENFSKACDVFRSSGATLTYVKSITGFKTTAGTVATTGGDWYVTDWVASTIKVYRSSTSGPVPKATLKDPGERPIDVDVDTVHKLVEVSNEFTPTQGSGSVSIYANGATLPTSNLKFQVPGGLTAGVGAAIDKNGNCFWSVYDTNKAKGYIVEFTQCKGAAKVIVQASAAFEGLAFDKNDNLFYANVSGSAGVYKCKGLTSCKLLTKFKQPIFVRFDAGWVHLWVTDLTAATITAVNPVTGKVEKTTPAHGGKANPTAGIAAAPGAAY